MAKKIKEEIPKVKNPVGRPSELVATLEQAKTYLMGGWKDVGDVIPSIAGLACYCGKNRDSIYQYQRESKDFSDIVKDILTMQENTLVNRGLSNDFNPSITKLILTKHGYSDKVEVDNTSTDGTMATRSPVYKIIAK